jgi:nitroimidazol reductase NimA-like FMN-containing flavoprotein (pyridoxamine 5'-phosphate oxidase superfamily)
MQIHELSPADCAEILGRTHLGHLACARFDQPYIVPIYFSFDAELSCLYALSLAGQKIYWMRENPKVCLEVGDIADKTQWTTVLVFGRYEELERGPDHAEARSRAERLFKRRRQWWLPAAGQTRARVRDELVLFRVQIDRLTGRRTARGTVASPITS